MTVNTVSEPVRICADCAAIKLLSEFRRRYRGRPERLSTCNDCHAARERQRRANHRRRRQGLQIQKLATAFCATRNQQQRRLVWQLGVSAAGGFTRFLETRHHTISAMIAERQYSPRLMKLYELIFEIHRDDDRRQAELLNALPDEELAVFLRRQIVEIIRDDPLLAVETAQQLGWTVIPPA